MSGQAAEKRSNRRPPNGFFGSALWQPGISQFTASTAQGCANAVSLRASSRASEDRPSIRSAQTRNSLKHSGEYAGHRHT